MLSYHYIQFHVDNINGGTLKSEDLKKPVVYTISHVGCPKGLQMEFQWKKIGADGYAGVDIIPRRDCSSFYLSVSHLTW